MLFIIQHLLNSKPLPMKPAQLLFSSRINPIFNVSHYFKTLKFVVMLKFWYLIILLIGQQILIGQANVLNLETKQSSDAIKATMLSNDDIFGMAIKKARLFSMNPEFRDQNGFKKGDILAFELFELPGYRAVIQSSITDINNVLSIVGKVEGFDFAYCYITLDGEFTSFSLDIPELNQKYITRLHPESRKNYLLQLDEKHLDYIEGGAPKISLETSGPIPGNDTEPTPETPRKTAIIPQKNNESVSSDGQGCLDDNDPAVLDVLVVYTPAARNWAISNNGNINTIISNAITRANLVTTNNNMFITFNLVHSAEINYTEVNSNTDLDNITNGNGVMSTVHTLRNTHKADFVVLMTLTEDTGGLGWLLTNKFGNPNKAFCLARVQQAGWTTTVIHEIGHNMGAHHHKAQLTQPGPTVWNNWPENTWTAGWRWVGSNGSRYCDIMTYNSGEHFEDGYDHSEVPYFSDPLVKYSNKPTGDATDGDNARSVNFVKHFASRYRDAGTMQYCAATGINTFYNISNVTFGSIDQEGGAQPYMDFTHCATDLIPEEAEELRVKINNPYYSNQLLVWIDFNNNNKFTDAGEAVYVSPIGSYSEYVANIITPPGTSPGLKRMRIRLHLTSDGPNANSCGESNHGTVHDYMVNIIDTGCYGAVIQKQPEDQATCVNNSSGVLSLEYIGSQPVAFQWQYLNGADWMDIEDGVPAGARYFNNNSPDLVIDSISSEGSYTYRCLISNCEGENQVISEPAIFQVNPAGEIPASPTSITGPVSPGSGSTYVYSVKPNPGYTYQWEFPEGWFILPGAESYEVTVDVGTQSGIVSVTPFNACGAGIPFGMNVNVIDFCDAGAQSSQYEYIKNVTFNTINNSSSRSTYSDFSHISTKVEIGETYPFNVTLGDGYSADQIVMWIDYNQNGNFTNPGERVYLSPKNDGPFTGNIKIPSHAVPGYARMRIRLHDTSQSPNTNSCDNSAFGEVEDYSIHIMEACEQVSILTQSGDTDMCSGKDTVNLAVEATGKLPFEFNWQYQLGDNWLNIGSNTPTGAFFMHPDSSAIRISGQPEQGIHRFRCQVTNCSGEKETVSEPFELTVWDIPAMAEIITGETTVCEQSLQHYAVSGYSDVNYHWHFPAGWQIQGESNTSEILVLTGSTGGFIGFSTENQCGISEALNVEITVNSKPATPVIDFNSTTEILSSNTSEGNQWHDQNGPIQGAIGQTHIPGKTADYFTIVTLKACASDTSNVIHVIPSDVDEITSDKILTLFPNPTTGFLTLKTNEMDLTSGKFELYNLSGQKFELVFNEYDEYSVVLDLRHLPSGQYTIVYKDNIMVRSGKFIKQ